MTAPKEQRIAMKSDIFKDAFKGTSARQGSFIPIITATGGRKEDFLADFTQQVAKSVPPEQVSTFTKAAEKRLIAGESVKFAELLGMERISELTGRKAISAASKKLSVSPRQSKISSKVASDILTTPPKGISYADFIAASAKQSTSNVLKRQTLRESKVLNRFLQTAKIIAPIGAVEGGFQEFSDAKAAGRKPRVENVLLGVGVGAATAGVLGGAILSLPRRGGLVSAPVSSFKRRSVELTGFLLDPLEKPGDLLADFTSPQAFSSLASKNSLMLSTKKAFLATRRSRVFTPSFSLTSTQSPSISETSTNNNVSGGKVFSFSPSVNLTLPQSISQSTVSTPSVSETSSFSLNSTVNVPSSTSTSVNTSVPTSTSTNVNTFLSVPTNVSTSVP
ncbi:hypothetical protein, partial [Lutibacter sp.]|uniref:hypothetical protein n=1 Tax=Lutibacter sp. TaxID=1925666 RepID=UPI0034A0766D